MRKKMLLNGVLALLVAVLAWQMIAVLQRQPEPLPQPKPAPPSAAAPVAQQQASPELQTMPPDPQHPVAPDEPASDAEVVVQKDLFRPDRTSPEKANEQAVPPPRLSGTMVIGSSAKAFLEDPITKKIRGYRVRETVAGYTVSEVHENSAVVLSPGKERIVLKIVRIETVKAPGVPPVALPAGVPGIGAAASPAAAPAVMKGPDGMSASPEGQGQLQPVRRKKRSFFGIR